MKFIEFGTYPQSNNGEREPIEWLILKEDDEKQYIISKHCLNCIPYDDNNGKTNWENSYAREWLNNSFHLQAFSVEEQEKIILSNIKTSSGIWNGKIDSGKTTQDKIFLPSVSEAILYFGAQKQNDIIAEQKRIARPTNVAYENGCFLWPLVYDKLKYTAAYKAEMGDNFNENNPYWHLQGGEKGKLARNNDKYEPDTTTLRWACQWFLRSNGHLNYIVREDGSIGCPYSIEIGHVGIRPAMWIKK